MYSLLVAGNYYSADYRTFESAFEDGVRTCEAIHVNGDHSMYLFTVGHIESEARQTYSVIIDTKGRIEEVAPL